MPQCAFGKNSLVQETTKSTEKAKDKTKCKEQKGNKIARNRTVLNSNHRHQVAPVNTLSQPLEPCCAFTWRSAEEWKWGKMSSNAMLHPAAPILYTDVGNRSVASAHIWKFASPDCPLATLHVTAESPSDRRLPRKWGMWHCLLACGTWSSDRHAQTLQKNPLF